ncbi:MAG: hypothetical protein CM1200mP18_05350 [Gammaproteobacteria bacterium]|nr:MAG: hypothetical protein CM1200mP18_05350 [Gammaproteobacteria bacterium]
MRTVLMPILQRSLLKLHKIVGGRAGLDCMTEGESISFVKTLFDEFLDGQPLMSRSAHLRGSAAWFCFKRVSNRNWVKDNIVLMGDAAHTAHFSIGSGPKLAMEDAIALAHLLNESDDRPIPKVSSNMSQNEKFEVLKIQSAARNSTEWFENVDRYAALPPEQFAYSLLTRSQRVSHEGLRQRDRVYLDHFESWFSQQAGRVGSAVVLPRCLHLLVCGICIWRIGWWYHPWLCIRRWKEYPVTFIWFTWVRAHWVVLD